ncbi:MAG: hypothetical protein IPL08_13740 [Saprospiraceae bacterium]|nr:hypothetical protein [Saprospiraceae bacterium]
MADTIYIRTGSIANKRTLEVKLKNYGNASVGKNKLRGIIDPSKVINEAPIPEAENNNELTVNGDIGFEFYVSDNIATAIYPPDFAMINTKDHFVLKASTSTVPLTKGNYVFQIDTTAYFNSQVKETAKVESEGGLIQYLPKIALVPDRVYYWRVSPDSISEVGYKWSQASFAYQPDEEEGWNQSHFFQFKQNEFVDLEISENTDRKFEFGKEYFNIKIKNKLWKEDDKAGYIVQNVNWSSSWAWRYMDAGVGIVVNNQKTLFDLFNPPGGSFGSINPTGGNIELFPFKTNTPEDRKKVIDFIETQIKKGYYLNFYTIQKNAASDYHPEEWAADSLIYGKSLFTILEKLGAKKIRQLEKKGAVPYAVQLVNGREGLLDEKIAENINETIECSSYLYRFRPNGFTNSRTITKFKNIGTLKYLTYNQNTIADKDTINVLASNLNQNSSIIGQDVMSSYNINIDETQFSILQLQMKVSDPEDKSPIQLKYWRIPFAPYPDAAISFVKSEPSSADNKIKQGQRLKIYYDVINTNYVPMDSILVKYTYVTGNNQSLFLYKKLKPLGIGQKISDMVEFSVGVDNSNEFRIIIEINPGSKPA